MWAMFELNILGQKRQRIGKKGDERVCVCV